MNPLTLWNDEGESVTLDEGQQLWAEPIVPGDRVAVFLDNLPFFASFNDFSRSAQLSQTLGG
jgi:hypothetical protein